MIRQIIINIPSFINNWLPVHKRKVTRLSFLQVLMAPFTIMMDEYKKWKTGSVTRAYVNGETLSMQWYLNAMFDPIGQGIEIQSAEPGGMFVALQAEVTPVLLAGLQIPAELSHFAWVPLAGEDVLTGSADFVVRVPVGLATNEPAIKKVINNYKLAGKFYIIIYY